ncbi:hypothetical protein ABZ942_04650 [Nocardia sp. NPDC046473]
MSGQTSSVDAVTGSDCVAAGKARAAVRMTTRIVVRRALSEPGDGEARA